MRNNLLIILSFFLFVSAHAANDKSFIWQVDPVSDSSGQVSTDGAIVYLMGSIHFADKSFYPLREEIEQAFNRSDSLVVELDVSKIDHQEYNQLLSETGVYKNGATIKDVISDETWLQLRQRLRDLNIPYDTVKHYKPGILVLTLAATQVMKMGFDPDLGVDAHFLSKALRQNRSGHDRSKQVIELETLEQQLNLFLAIPNGELLLKESLHSLDEAELLMKDMVSYWKQGDEKQMNKLLFEDALNDYPAFAEIYDSLIYQRNYQMSNKIEQMLRRGGSYFVVVGSGHLIGEKGIVNKLKENGYRVKRL